MNYGRFERRSSGGLLVEIVETGRIQFGLIERQTTALAELRSAECAFTEDAPVHAEHHKTIAECSISPIADAPPSGDPTSEIRRRSETIRNNRQSAAVLYPFH